MSYKSRKASELTSQERIMVKRIINASLLEQERGAYQFSVHDAVNRAAFYTGLTPQVLLKIKANMHMSSDKSKTVTKDSKKNKRDGNSKKYFKLCHRFTLMNILDNMFSSEFYTRSPTCSELFRAVENDLPKYDSYNTGYLQVANFLKKRYHTKGDCNASRARKEVFEIGEVGLQRYTYLKDIREYRKQNRNIIYLDETWVDDKLNCSKIWDHIYDLQKIDDLKYEVILITLSAASKNGFLPEALKLTTATNTETDSLQLKHFKSWLSLQLLRCLPKSSIIVVDNELYHECSLWRHPAKTATKIVMCTWLRKNNSKFHFNLDTPTEELYSLIQKQAQINSVKGIKNVLERGGHKLLKLPAYMSKLNPFELMWDKLNKDLGSSKSESIKISDVKDVISDRISKITSEDWNTFDEEVRKREEYLWTNDKRLLDKREELERLYIEQKNKESIKK